MRAEKLFIHLIFNAYWQPLEFELPQLIDQRQIKWRRWIDTGLESPNDIVDWSDAPPIPHDNYRSESRSVVVLLSQI
jgi:glycogen operon protein